MSPRRRFGDVTEVTAAGDLPPAAPGDSGAGGGPADYVDDDYFAVAPRAPRRWGLPVLSAIVALVIAAAIGAGTWMLVEHERDRRVMLTDASALGYTQEFMIGYTSLDPFNANAYADRIKGQATGEFAKNFNERLNEILIQVARSEPSTGEVLAAGVSRHHDDGSTDVLLAMKVTSKTPDGKSTIESGSRWLATTVREGQQWKISNLIQVI